MAQTDITLADSVITLSGAVEHAGGPFHTADLAADVAAAKSLSATSCSVSGDMFVGGQVSFGGVPMPGPVGITHKRLFITGTGVTMVTSVAGRPSVPPIPHGLDQPDAASTTQVELFGALEALQAEVADLRGRLAALETKKT